MTTNRTSRRAEDFDRALSAESGAAVDPAMASLLAVAGALAALPQRPAPAFRDALRTRLMAEAASMVPAASVPAASVPAARGLQHALSKPAMQIATGGLAAAVAVTGVGVGASRSLPGDPLYGLKRTIERWQVGLAGGQSAEADALLEHAQTRLDEIRALLENGALSRVDAEIAALAADLKSATDRLLAEAKAGSRDAYDRLQALLAAYGKQLVALYDNVPVDSRTAVSGALQTLNVARARLAVVPPPPVVVTPSPRRTTPPPTSIVPSTPPPTSIVPSTPPPTTPTSILPSTPTITPSPTSILPTLPVTVPPLAP